MPQIKVGDIITHVTLNTINGILHFLSSFSNERIYIVAAGAGGGGFGGHWFDLDFQREDIHCFKAWLSGQQA
jgi:hypothetical protein